MKTKQEVIAYLRSELAKEERQLRAREQMAKGWSGGTNKEWREVGCKLSKKQRGRVAFRHHRIAAMDSHRDWNHLRQLGGPPWVWVIEFRRKTHGQ